MSFQGKNLNGIFKQRYRKDVFLKEVIKCINCDTGMMKCKLDGKFADNDIKHYFCGKCGTHLYQPENVTRILERNRK